MTLARNITPLFLSLALSAAAALPAAAAESALPRPLLDCQKETDSLRRLVCYDREMARAGGAAAVASPAPAVAAPPPAAPRMPAAAPPAAVAAPAAVAGAAVAGGAAAGIPSRLGDEQVAAKRRDRDDAAEQTLTAGIVSLKPWKAGANVITLDNGQVWRQEEVESYFPLAAGDTVRIERGLLGSYHLTPVREGWKKRTRVTRVR